MTVPVVTEIQRPREPVVPDPFIDDVANPDAPQPPADGPRRRIFD